LLAITNLITVLNFLGLYDFVVILYIWAISTFLAVLGFALILYFLLFGLLIILNFVTALGCLVVLNSLGSTGFPHRISELMLAQDFSRMEKQLGLAKSISRKSSPLQRMRPVEFLNGFSAIIREEPFR
jgi:hypothetical protein